MSCNLSEYFDERPDPSLRDHGMQLERREVMSANEFTQTYIKTNKPVIVTDGMRNWRAASLWTPDYFRTTLGSCEVQLYDNAFNFIGLSCLSDYITEYFGQNSPLNPSSIPYVRAYCQFRNVEFLWADKLFSQLQNDWELPYFLPKSDYLLPYQMSEKIQPNQQAFPAKGLFISAKGCATHFHIDPWCSDAVLCQIHGEKEVTLFSPEQLPSTLIDMNHLNENELRPYLARAYRGLLKPGEILYIPNGWTHYVASRSDSISLTWNFVHTTTGDAFLKYLSQNLSAFDQSVMAYFYP